MEFVSNVLKKYVNINRDATKHENIERSDSPTKTPRAQQPQDKENIAVQSSSRTATPPPWKEDQEDFATPPAVVSHKPRISILENFDPLFAGQEDDEEVFYSPLDPTKTRPQIDRNVLLEKLQTLNQTYDNPSSLNDNENTHSNLSSPVNLNPNTVEDDNKKTASTEKLFTRLLNVTLSEEELNLVGEEGPSVEKKDNKRSNFNLIDNTLEDSSSFTACPSQEAGLSKEASPKPQKGNKSPIVQGSPRLLPKRGQISPIPSPESRKKLNKTPVQLDTTFEVEQDSGIAGTTSSDCEKDINTTQTLNTTFTETSSAASPVLNRCKTPENNPVIIQREVTPLKELSRQSIQALKTPLKEEGFHTPLSSPANNPQLVVTPVNFNLQQANTPNNKNEVSLQNISPGVVDITPINKENSVTPSKEDTTPLEAVNKITPLKEDNITPTPLNENITPVVKATTPLKEDITSVENKGVTPLKEDNITPVVKVTTTPLNEDITPVVNKVSTPVVKATTPLKEDITPFENKGVTPLKEDNITPVVKVTTTPLTEDIILVENKGVTSLKEDNTTPVIKVTTTPLNEDIIPVVNKDTLLKEDNNTPFVKVTTPLKEDSIAPVVSNITPLKDVGKVTTPTPFVKVTLLKEDNTTPVVKVATTPLKEDSITPVVSKVTPLKEDNITPVVKVATTPLKEDIITPVVSKVTPLKEANLADKIVETIKGLPEVTPVKEVAQSLTPNPSPIVELVDKGKKTPQATPNSSFVIEGEKISRPKSPVIKPVSEITPEHCGTESLNNSIYETPLLEVSIQEKIDQQLSSLYEDKNLKVLNRKSAGQTENKPVKVPEVGHLHAQQVDQQQDSSENMATIASIEQENSNLKMQLKQLQEMADKVPNLEQMLCDVKLQLNQSQQSVASLELQLRQKEEVIIKAQSEFQKKEQVYRQENKQLMEKLEAQSEPKDSQIEIEELKATIEKMKIKEEKLIAQMSMKNNEEGNFKQVIEEYQRAINMHVSELEKLKVEYDIAKQHLSTLEVSFSDVHQKYERSKSIITGYKNNEETLTQTLAKTEEELRKSAEKYESLKVHAKAQIDKSNRELALARDKFQLEMQKLIANIKRLEIKNASLNIALDQKVKECAAYASLCEEMTGRSENT